MRSSPLKLKTTFVVCKHISTAAGSPSCSSHIVDPLNIWLRRLRTVNPVRSIKYRSHVICNYRDRWKQPFSPKATIFMTFDQPFRISTLNIWVHCDYVLSPYSLGRETLGDKTGITWFPRSQTYENKSRPESVMQDRELILQGSGWGCVPLSNSSNSSRSEKSLNSIETLDEIVDPGIQ